MSPKLLNLLLLLIPVTFYYVYIDPMYNGNPGMIWTPEFSIATLKAQKVQYENSLNQITLISEEAKKLKKDYDGVDQKIKDKVMVMVPDTVDPIKLRNEILAIANKADIGISGLKVVDLARTPHPDLLGYKVTFSAQARYSDLKKLLESFEKSKRVYSVSSVSIQHKEKKEGDLSDGPVDNEPDMLQMAITYDVYYSK